jgi:glycopeptide antibiotics resistance protein
MDRTISYLKKLFHIFALLLIILSLYPGNIIGFLIYGDIRYGPQLTKDFLYISSNHLYVYFLISVLAFFSYLRDRKFKLVVIYLFFLSIILEVAHLVIDERAFQIADLTGNILGVLIAYTIMLIYKLWRKQ